MTTANGEGAGRPTIPMVIELGPRLERLASPPAGRDLADRVAAALGPTLEELGLAGDPAVTVVRARARRAVRIRVHGAVVPFPPQLMPRVWWSVAPPDLLDLPVRASEEATPGFPDSWIDLARIEQATSMPRRRWRSLMGRYRPRGHQLVAEYLVRLTVEVVRRQPAALLPDRADPVRRELLGLGLAARDGPLLRSIQEAATATGRSPWRTVETAFTELRPNHVEVHIDRPRLRQMGIQAPIRVYEEQVEEGLRSDFQQMEAGLLDGLGVRIPPILLVPSGALAPGTIAVKVGDWLEAPVPVLDDGFAVVAVKQELERLAHRLVDLDEVDQLLALLGATFPVLVRAVVSTVPLDELTRVLRGLLRERVSVRDLRGILELVIRYATDGPGPDGWDGCLAFVREGMADYLTRAYGGGIASRTVVTLDPGRERRLEDVVETGSRLDDDAEEAWRDAVWSALQPISDGPSAASVVTSPAIRSAVRTLLAPEFPELPVLSRTELDGGPVEPAVTVAG
jgi:hypothetical protein